MHNINFKPYFQQFFFQIVIQNKRLGGQKLLLQVQKIGLSRNTPSLQLIIAEVQEKKRTRKNKLTGFKVKALKSDLTYTFGAYTKHSHTNQSETSKQSPKKQSRTKNFKTI